MLRSTAGSCGFFLIFLCLAIAVASPAGAQCYDEALACKPADDETCKQLPTSLRPMSDKKTLVGFSGWTQSTANCGATFSFPPDPCGKKLSGDHCDGTAQPPGGGSCCRGLGCEYSVTELSESLLGAAVETGEESWELPLSELPSKLWTGSSAVAASKVEEAFRELRGIFSGWSSLRIQADVAVWLDRSGGVTGEGSVDFWQRGDMYRERISVDPRLGLASNVDLAFDGATFWRQLESGGILSLSTFGLGPTPGPVANPLFLPVAFLSRNETCLVCDLQVLTIRAEERWRDSLSRARLLRGGDSPLYVFPGSADLTDPYAYRVKLLPSGLPRRIELVRANGVAFLRIELSHFLPADYAGRPRFEVPRFPRHIVISSLEGESEEVRATVHYHVRSMILDPDIPPEQFTIDGSGARMVIDEDHRILLKHPQLLRSDWDPRFLPPPSTATQ